MTQTSSSSADTTPPAGADTGTGTGTVTVELSVSGMHCGSCSALIEESLSEQPGVASASVDLDAGRAVVVYDPTQLVVDQLTAAVAEAGYSATPVG